MVWICVCERLYVTSDGGLVLRFLGGWNYLLVWIVDGLWSG